MGIGYCKFSMLIFGLLTYSY
jgi:hypothetical protein